MLAKDGPHAPHLDAMTDGRWALVEGGTHLLTADGWQIEGEKGIVGCGRRGAFVAREKRISRQRISSRWQRPTPCTPPLSQTCHE